MLPLSLGHRPGDAFARNSNATVSLAEWLGDVHALAVKLPAVGHVLNLCESSYAFSVAFAAALVRRQTNLLPASRTPDLLARLAARYPDCVAVVDHEDAQQAFPAVIANWPASPRTTPIEQVPMIPAQHVAALAFTSGSTGDPMPHAKTWGSLVRGARSEAKALCMTRIERATLVGTVPQQHMYGLESTLMLAWQNGHAVYGARPFYPADIADALARVPGPRILVTTPLHLRALIDSDTDLPELALLVCATAPLDTDLARGVEARYGVTVREIYGCTETGQIAARRTVDGPEWTLMEGIGLTCERDLFYARGGHVETSVPLADDLALRDDGRFELLGRKADVINIAGKRSSLAHLTAHLLAVPGVVDAAVLMPPEREGGTARVMAVVVAPSVSVTAILDALRERIDAVFLPRPLYRVDKLPRNATGKLPRESLLSLAAELERGQNAPS